MSEQINKMKYRFLVGIVENGSERFKIAEGRLRKEVGVALGMLHEDMQRTTEKKQINGKRVDVWTTRYGPDSYKVYAANMVGPTGAAAGGVSYDNLHLMRNPKIKKGQPRGIFMLRDLQMFERSESWVAPFIEKAVAS